jgi:YVTN family beta-propeller protein
LGVVVNPDGSKVYVTNAISSTVSVIDTATNSVSATIPVPRLRPHRRGGHT